MTDKFLVDAKHLADVSTELVRIKKKLRQITEERIIGSLAAIYLSRRAERLWQEASNLSRTKRDSEMHILGYADTERPHAKG